MKRTIAKFASVALIASTICGASAMSVDACHDCEITYLPNGFINESHKGSYWQEDIEELNKHVVDLCDPAEMYKIIMRSPNNPQNRAKAPQTEEEKAKYEKELKAFRESLITTMRENFGIELGEAETKALFSQGTALNKGDVNFDGRHNAKDVIAVQRFILNPKNASNLQWYLADYDDNGKVNAKDVIAIMRAIID